MISGLKWFFSKKEDNGNEISLKNALDELHKPDPYELVDEATLEKNRMSDAIKDFNCFSQLGVITSLSHEDGVIDKHLPFTKFMAEPFFSDLRIGVKCVFLAYKASEDMPLKLVKITSLNSDTSWENSVNTIEPIDDVQQTFFNTRSRAIYGIVTEKHRSMLTVLTGNDESISVDLDTVKNNCNCIIVVGDMLIMSCKVQSDATHIDFNGEILQIETIAFQRHKVETNYVTKVFDSGALLGGDCIHYYKSYEEKMQRGDVVDFEAVESEQTVPSIGILSWRVISIIKIRKIVDATANARKVEVVAEVSTDGFLKWDPIQIQWNFNEVREIQQQKLTITNNSKDKTYNLIKYSVFNKNCVKFAENQQIEGKSVKPGESVEFILKAKCQLYGTYKDKLVIEFDLTTLNIPLLLNLSEGEILSGPTTTSLNTKQNLAPYRLSSREQRTIDMVPGERITKNPRFLDKRIGENPVPDFLRDIVLRNSSYVTMVEEINVQRSWLFDSLMPKNYFGKLKTLVHLEELACELAFRSFQIDRAYFRVCDGYLKLMIKGVSERRPSITIGDSVRVVNPFAEGNDIKEYEGCIHKVLSDSILLKFHESFHSNYNGSDYRIRFIFSRSNYKKQMHSLDVVVNDIFKENTVGKDFMFPQQIVMKEAQVDVELTEDGKLMLKGRDQELPWYNTQLNQLQKQAIVSILRGDARPVPYIVFGPPGTGKTITVIETILQIATLIPSSRILVGTPSNSSANLITELLVKSNVLTEGEFIRLVSFNQIERELIPEHLAKYCGTVDISHDNGKNNQTIITESGLKLKVQKSLIGKNKVTISTLVTLGSLMHIRFRQGHFTHIVIDEAGQSVETETLIPISFLTKDHGQVILAGDPEQLGPIISSKLARELKFDKSFLERLLEQSLYLRDTDRFETGYNNLLVTKLLMNYRSLPSILTPFNNHFYHGELKATIDPNSSPEAKLLKYLDPILWNPKKVENRNCGFFFINVNGQNRRSQDSPSWFNGAEAKNVFQFLVELYRNDVNASDIGIITPYNQQVRVIRGLITEAKLDMPKVGSVEEFQGQERKIILISTVRTTESLIQNDLKFGLGFVNCVKRLNVSISRARALLVIFGNHTSLYNNDTHWKSIIEYAQSNNTYYGNDM